MKTLQLKFRTKFTALLMDVEEKEPEEIANESKRIFEEASKSHLKKRTVKKQP